MIRILIADDHDVVRSELRRVLEAQPGWEVVAKAADGKDAIGKAAATTPDVAVLDSMMPLVNGVEATRQIRWLVCARTEVLIFTIHDVGAPRHNWVFSLMGAVARSSYRRLFPPIKARATRWEISSAEVIALMVRIA